MLGFRDRGIPRTRLFAIAVALMPLLVAAAGGVACTESSSTDLPPTTGILIRAETLTAGHGCGEGPTQLYKYAVAVFGYGGEAAGPPTERASYDAFVTSNVFDCYTDSIFISLPNNGNTTFRLEVFAYNRAQYDEGRRTIDVAASVRPPSSVAGELRAQTSPTWTTECTATQQEQVQALASCEPLAPGLSGLPGHDGTAGPTTITLATTRFELPDGRIGTCAPEDAHAGTDAGVDADVDAESDVDANLPDAADAALTPGSDAEPVVTFAKVRVRTRVGAQVIADAVVPCPALYSAEVAPEPARYDLDVGLLDPTGAPIDPHAVTVCTVTSATGKTSSAVCPGSAEAAP